MVIKLFLVLLLVEQYIALGKFFQLTYYTLNYNDNIIMDLLWKILKLWYYKMVSTQHKQVTQEKS